MIRLRVVGTTDDYSHLVLSNKPRGKRASHAVVIDKRLLKVLQDAVYGRRAAAIAERKTQLPPREEPRFPPREIQRMLRAGDGPEKVARAAGVNVSYVRQFAGPIEYERQGVIREAQSRYLSKPRLGTSGLPLGEAVARNVAVRRIRMDDDRFASAWSAHRREGQPWVISFSFPFRGSTRKATWKYDPRTRSVVAANTLATDMGWVANGHARDEREAAARAEKKTAAAKKAATKKTKRKPSAKKTATRKPAKKSARKPVRKAARKPAKKSARKPVRKAARKPAKKTTKRKPAKRTATRARKTARKPAARRRATTKRTASRRTPARRRR